MVANTPLSPSFGKPSIHSEAPAKASSDPNRWLYEPRFSRPANVRQWRRARRRLWRDSGKRYSQTDVRHDRFDILMSHVLLPGAAARRVLPPTQINSRIRAFLGADVQRPEAHLKRALFSQHCC